MIGEIAGGETGMPQRPVLKRRPSKRVAILLALLAVVVVAGGGGWWALNNLQPKDPQVIYVVYDPGSTATAGPTASPDEASPTAESSESATATVTATATASATATPPPVPGATPSPKPDLTVDPLAPPSMVCNQLSIIRVDIRNNGTVATPRATQARLTDMYGGDETYSTVFSVPVLGPGAIFDGAVGITLDTACNETHILVVEVDPNDLIDEEDEGNNVRHVSYLLAGKPDLRTYGITISPADPKCNEQFTAQITVWNTGTAAATSDVVKFVDTWNGTTQATAYVSFPTIPAGETTVVHVHFTLTDHCGQHHVMAVEIDPYHRIDEVYETNNTYTKDYILYAHL
jgi:hypothetical protein